MMKQSILFLAMIVASQAMRAHWRAGGKDTCLNNHHTDHTLHKLCAVCGSTGFLDSFAFGISKHGHSIIDAADFEGAEVAGAVVVTRVNWRGLMATRNNPALIREAYRLVGGATYLFHIHGGGADKFLPNYAQHGELSIQAGKLTIDGPFVRKLLAKSFRQSSGTAEAILMAGKAMYNMVSATVPQSCAVWADATTCWSKDFGRFSGFCDPIIAASEKERGICTAIHKGRSIYHKGVTKVDGDDSSAHYEPETFSDTGKTDQDQFKRL